MNRNGAIVSECEISTTRAGLTAKSKRRTRARTRARGALGLRSDCARIALEARSDRARIALGLRSDCARIALEARSDRARGALEARSTRARPALDPRSTRARRGLDAGSTRARGGLEAGSRRARRGLDAGSTRARGWLEAGSRRARRWLPVDRNSARARELRSPSARGRSASTAPLHSEPEERGPRRRATARADRTGGPRALRATHRRAPEAVAVRTVLNARLSLLHVRKQWIHPVHAVS